MQDGYWKVYLKSGKIIDDDRVTMFETNSNDYRLCQWIDNEKDILYVIGKDSLNYAKYLDK